MIKKGIQKNFNLSIWDLIEAILKHRHIEENNPNNLTNDVCSDTTWRKTYILIVFPESTCYQIIKD